jgi:hypothetical protein
VLFRRIHAGFSAHEINKPTFAATRSEHHFGPFPAPSCELVTMMCLGSARLRDTLISLPRVFCSLNGWLLCLPEESPCGLARKSVRCGFRFFQGNYCTSAERSGSSCGGRTQCRPLLTLDKSDLHFVLSDLWKFQGFCCGCHYVAFRRDHPGVMRIKCVFSFMHSLMTFLQRRGYYDRVRYYKHPKLRCCYLEFC